MPSAFEVISEFVINLHSYFEKENIHSLNLYHRLITNHKHEDISTLDRHISIWRDFCVANRDAIRDRTGVFDRNVSFSSKIYVNLNHMFTKADENTAHVMCEYLLTISAYLDPESNAKQILQRIKTEPEAQQEDIGQMLGGLLSSDVMNNMMAKVLGSGIDLTTLADSATQLLTAVQKEVDSSDDPNLKALSKLITDEQKKLL